MKVQKHNYLNKSVSLYQYWARVERVVDGDTVDLIVSLGFELTIKIRVRLLGINAPEIYSVKKSSPEYKRGIKSKEFLESLIPKEKWIEVKIHLSAQREKYGRWLAELFSESVNLNEELVKKGHAIRI